MLKVSKGAHVGGPTPQQETVEGDTLKVVCEKIKLHLCSNLVEFSVINMWKSNFTYQHNTNPLHD